MEAEEETWKDLQIFFATSTGNVRKNALSDFTNVKANGKIAMKLPENTTLVGAQICKNDNDVLLTTAKGKAFPFAVVSSTSLSFLQICAPTSVVFSGNFIAIFPFAFTFVKSDNAFFRTLPVEVAKNI